MDAKALKRRRDYLLGRKKRYSGPKKYNLPTTWSGAEIERLLLQEE